MPGERPLRSPERQIRRDLLMAALALVSVGIALRDLAAGRVSREWTVWDVVDLLIVAVFIADVGRDLYLAEDRAAWLRAHWWELPALIPLTPALLAELEAARLLRGLRLFRLARVVRLARLVGMGARLSVRSRYVSRVAERARVVQILGAGGAAVLAGATVAYLLESPVNPRFATAEGALWFALNMMTNMGYATDPPVTPGGYVLAAALQVLGIAFIGVFTASLAGALLREPEPED